METTAEVFGITAADARLTGRIMSWFWLMAVFEHGPQDKNAMFAFVSVIYNFLHYYPEIGDFVSDFIGYEN